MAETSNRSEEIFDKNKEAKQPPDAGGGIAGRINKMIVDIRGLLTQGGHKGGTPAPPGDKKGEPLLGALLSTQKIDLRTINQALAVTLVGLLALTVYVIMRQPPDTSRVTAAVSKIKFTDLQDAAITPLGELALYMDQIKTRDIFNEYKVYVPPPPVVKKEPPPPPPPPKVTIEEKAKNLTLMGISWGSDPKAMIKNEATQEVNFFSEGQLIKGTEVKVKTISAAGVIIWSGEDEMKMK